MTKKMTTEEKIQWKELCEWVEINIFNYDIEYKHLCPKTALVLKGLCNNQPIANNKIKKTNEIVYPSNVVLMAFKVNKIKILHAIKNKCFENEFNKMFYVCSIVKKDIDDIYQRYLRTLEVNHDKN